MDNSRLSNRRRRRFTLLDALVLVGATGIALRFSRLAWELHEPTAIPSVADIARSLREGRFPAAPDHVLFPFEVAAPGLICWGFSLCLLRWLPPHPRRSRLVHQPGAVAMLAVSIVMAFVGAGWVGFCMPLVWAGKFVAKGSGWMPNSPVPFKVMVVGMLASGATIAASWCCLAIGGRSRSDLDWIEWAGRCLGAIYIASAPVYLWSALLP